MSNLILQLIFSLCLGACIGVTFADGLWELRHDTNKPIFNVIKVFAPTYVFIVYMFFKSYL